MMSTLRSKRTVVPAQPPSNGFTRAQLSIVPSARQCACTVCGTDKDCKLDKVYAHPVLKVLICEKCYEFYIAGEFTKDHGGHDEQCRLCRKGGKIIMCDTTGCTYSFCIVCVTRIFTRHQRKNILAANPWLCLSCDESQLPKHIKEKYDKLTPFLAVGSKFMSDDDVCVGNTVVSTVTSPSILENCETAQKLFADYADFIRGFITSPPSSVRDMESLVSHLEMASQELATIKDQIGACREDEGPDEGSRQSGSLSNDIILSMQPRVSMEDMAQIATYYASQGHGNGTDSKQSSDSEVDVFARRQPELKAKFTSAVRLKFRFICFVVSFLILLFIQPCY